MVLGLRSSIFVPASCTRPQPCRAPYLLNWWAIDPADAAALNTRTPGAENPEMPLARPRKKEGLLAEPFSFPTVAVDHAFS
jgi:hypothetical protein